MSPSRYESESIWPGLRHTLQFKVRVTSASCSPSLSPPRRSESDRDSRGPGRSVSIAAPSACLPGWASRADLCGPTLAAAGDSDAWRRASWQRWILRVGPGRHGDWDSDVLEAGVPPLGERPDRSARASMGHARVCSARVHPHTHMLTRAQPRARMRPCMHAHAHAPPARTQTHTRTHAACARTHTLNRVRVNTRTYLHHALAPARGARARARTHTRIRAHAHPRMHAGMHSHAAACTNVSNDSAFRSAAL
jgi:hypothetical protein